MFRKSRVTDVGEKVDGNPDVCFEHNLPSVRKRDSQVKLTVTSTDPEIQRFEVNLDPKSTLSDAIHVGLAGFRPDDPKKLAVLSC